MMKTSVIEQLKRTDLDFLTQIIRQDRNCPSFVIHDWQVQPLSGKGVMNPDGLFLVQGNGIDRDHPTHNIQSWQVVVKNFTVPEMESTPDNMWYWKREVLLFQSGILDRVPGPVCWPRSYGVLESEGSFQVWMEHIQDETPARWTMDHFRLAARELGRWNGRCSKEQVHPSAPWLSRELYRGWVELGNRISWRDYSSPFLQQALSSEDFSRACRVFDYSEHFFAVLNKLPQVFSHLDFHRRNLMIRKNKEGHDEVVAVDWAMVGTGPLGGDLYALIGLSAFVHEVEPEDMPALETVVFSEYLSGLRDAGWGGDPNEIRLAYTAWFGLWLGGVLPAMIAGWTTPDNVEEVRSLFGCELDQLAARWGILCRFALSRAEEAMAYIAARKRL